MYDRYAGDPPRSVELAARTWTASYKTLSSVRPPEVPRARVSATTVRGK